MGDDAWERWREAAARWFPPKLARRDALPESEVAAAEKRLGVRLPARLRELYRTSGRRRDLHATHDRLFAPNKLIFVGGALVFYERSDSLAAWGVARAHLGKDVSADDPPVARALNQPPWSWEPDHDTLSSFLFTELVWQHVNASTSVALDADVAALDRVAARCTSVALEGCHWDVRGCWERDGTVVFARAPTEDHIQLYVGSTSQEALDSALAELDLKNSGSMPVA